MNYASIKFNDVANGPGIRTSLFVSGCTHRCKGCFNEVAWDFNYGEKFTKDVEDTIIESLSPNYVTGITILGGEPFEHSNQIGLLPLLRRVRSTYPDKSIWCFTGYLFDKDILNDMCNKWPETYEMINLIDVLVDGKYVEELRSLMLKFKGSSNQRTILVKESLKCGEVVLMPDT